MVFLVINKGDITNNADMIRLYHEGNMIYNWKKKYIYIYTLTSGILWVCMGIEWGYRDERGHKLRITYVYIYIHIYI